MTSEVPVDPQAPAPTREVTVTDLGTPVALVAPPAEAPKALVPYSGAQRTSFADRSAGKSDQLEKYKAPVDRLTRICILDPTILLRGRAHGHFLEGSKDRGLGYVNCKSEFQRSGDMEIPVKSALCCSLLPDSRVRLATFVIEYSVDGKTGMPTKPLAIGLKAWVFSPDKFEDMVNLEEQGYIIGETDLIVSCEDASYQKMKFMPGKSCVRMHPQFKTQFDSMIESWKMLSLPRLAKVIGTDCSDADLMEKLGPAGSSASARPVVAKQDAPSDIHDLFN